MVVIFLLSSLSGLKKFGDFSGKQDRPRPRHQRMPWQRDVNYQNIGISKEYCCRVSPKSLEYTSFKRKLEGISSYIAMISCELYDFCSLIWKTSCLLSFFIGIDPSSYYSQPLAALTKAPIVQLQRSDGFTHPHKEAIIKRRLDVLLEIYKLST